MGFVTNRWQPVSAGPGPTPVPTWELVKSNITATTNFDYSNLEYTEYLILVYNKNSTSSLYEMFYAPAFGVITQYAGYTGYLISLYSQSNLSLQFTVTNSSGSTQTSNFRYTIYGRNKAIWSMVSDKSAIPDYTELATSGGYYTPFKYQDDYFRVGGGTHWSRSGTSYRPSFSGSIEQVSGGAYRGNYSVYTRIASNETNWNHITSSSKTVSIESISYSEMFIISRRMQHLYGGSNYYTFQSLYVIPEMQKGTYYTGGYTGVSSNNKYSGSYGTIITSNTSITASCTYLNMGTISDYFQRLDIYYR